jgi:hypothetical protein
MAPPRCLIPFVEVEEFRFMVVEKAGMHGCSATALMAGQRHDRMAG